MFSLLDWKLNRTDINSDAIMNKEKNKSNIVNDDNISTI